MVCPCLVKSFQQKEKFEHQVGLRNRQDCRNKERNSERDMTL